jgi:LmbE family N-acetylglucosaminyl deacetylase
MRRFPPPRGGPSPLLRPTSRRGRGRCRAVHAARSRSVHAARGWVLALLLLAVPAPALAQAVPSDRGVAAAGLLLRQLDGEKRVLMVAAHPDDEDTALLAALARESGARAAYLSLSRGEGGQNLIGPELGVGLGIIRTGELQAARRLDGAEQYFTRAFDFGFSRSAQETLAHWPEEALVEDVVRVIRRFRPHVVVSVFEGSPRDGHGQHQASGIVTPLAFDAAGDPARFPDQIQEGLAPWTPLKLYTSTRFRPAEATLQVETGRLDPLLGRSPFQVAMESRSQHRSQDMGAPQHPGPRAAPLALVRSRVGEVAVGASAAPGVAPAPDEGLFAGIDTTLAGVATRALGEGAGEALQELEGYRTALVRAGDALHALAPFPAADPLGQALDHLRAAREAAVAAPASGAGQATGIGTLELGHALDQREDGTTRALLAAAGIVVEARTLQDRVVPGEALEAEVRVWNGGPFPVEGVRPGLRVPEGWGVTLLPADAPEPPAVGGFFGGVGGRVAEGPMAVPSGELVRWRFQVEVPEDAPPTREYHLEAPLDGSLHRWPEDRRALWGLPGTPPPLEAEVALRVSDRPLRVEVPVPFVDVDKADGEFREPFLVVPRIAVAMERSWMAWPRGSTAPRTLMVRLRGEAGEGAAGEVELELPQGWTAEPARAPFRLERAGDEVEVAFRVSPLAPPEEGRVRIGARVRDDAGRLFAEGFEIIDYPHIDRVPLYHPAEVAVTVLEARVAEGLRVGYVMGSGDDGAEALRQMGAEVELLGPEELRTAELDRFHAVVLGVRAYETRPDLPARTPRILEFARRGGTVVAQYNKYEYPEGDFAPYAVSMARPHDRITDPAAPVTLLDPHSPVFTGPNPIGPGDFDGWVQERGLYFLNQWDDRFVPLLEMADPGLDPVRGGLLVAPVGEGLYIYTGLAFFRQLPEGVPGAFRLLANLVSLRATEWRAHHGGDAP